MTLPLLHRPATTLVASDVSKGRLRFALSLSALMTILLAMIPVLGKSAGILVMATLVPLALWCAFTNTEKALYVYCAWCWMDGSIRGLFDFDPVSVVARDILLALIVIGWAASRQTTRGKDPIRTPPGTILVVLFVINCLLQVMNPYSLGLMSCLAGFKMHLAFLPLLFVGYDVFRRREQVHAFLIFLTLATLVIAAVSVIQYRQGPSWTYAHFPGSQQVISQDAGDYGQSRDPQVAGFKPPGTTTFGGGTGGFIGLIVPLTFALVLLDHTLRFSLKARAAFIGIIFVFTVTVFLNGVRAGLVDGLVGIIFCGLFTGGKNVIRIIMLGGLCLALGLVGWTYSQSLSSGHVADRFGSTLADPNKALHDDRVTFFDQFDYLITQAPLGVGLGRVGASNDQFASDRAEGVAKVNSEAYLGNMMAETGILGAVLILSIAITFLWHGSRCVRRLSDSDDRAMAAAMFAVLAVIVANFFASPILLVLPAGPLFWLLAAMLLRVYGARGIIRRQNTGISE